MVVDGLDAAILIAEIEVPQVRPGGKEVEFRPQIKWEDATEEQRQTLHWNKRFTMMNGEEKWATRPNTEEEKAEMRLNRAWRLGEMFKFILENCSAEDAIEFYNRWNKDFKEYEVEIDMNIPYCKYSEDHQCTIDCPFFKGVCVYEN